ncbi:SDR family NAD(P)-dependent oxidoreductase [Paenibacillus aceris]|uniref:NAD(P)-dependent dehydrogenase (Short-subunit alcohol dehydrogenase family) n=1 Tax=Paenibacillus aceris TaxID=869555 RepID=A0ABS4I486_9BACL|nr:SDR family oxidoreductase [Paenibacillus aceris]MBP1965336.1 NAD(P)-dependent dehydrogenase (short-subunit alcohol dehydrogenase family) [Paenibacillus aceris]NHW36016.1 SDR family oxidoreductase [Paenibacillus aceris]
MLSDKVAIVTGSTSGIGESIAKTLAKQGVKVLVTGKEQEQGERIVDAIKSEGGAACLFISDLLDPRTPDQLVELAVSEWGRVDIIVNNAAMVCNKPVEDITHDDWDRLFTVNLKAPFFLVQAALPYLKAHKGTVINISSINGKLNDYHNLVYDTMKAGLNHMTSGLALDFRKEGIRVNALMPAGVATPLLEGWFKQLHADPEEARKAAEAVMNAPNVASPQQIADGVLFLAGGLASWVNGAVIPIEGGFSIGHPQA